MKKNKFSYASSFELNLPQRLIVKTIEKLSGQKKLTKLYEQYDKNYRDPKLFWSDMVRLLELKINIKSKNTFKIPKSGPVLIIANHPFGMVDGIILCSLVSKFRDDFKIITHEVLRFTNKIDKYILPIYFNKDQKKSFSVNLLTHKKAKKHLDDNGVIILFPAGGVAVAKSLRSKAVDAYWKTLSAKLINVTKADVFPVYFDGKNSFLYHLFASKMKNQTLKYSSYLHETKTKIGKEINIYCDQLLKNNDLRSIGNRKETMVFLRDYTMNLINK